MMEAHCEVLVGDGAVPQRMARSFFSRRVTSNLSEQFLEFTVFHRLVNFSAAKVMIFF